MELLAGVSAEAGAVVERFLMCSGAVGAGTIEDVVDEVDWSSFSPKPKGCEDAGAGVLEGPAVVMEASGAFPPPVTT